MNCDKMHVSVVYVISFLSTFRISSNFSVKLNIFFTVYGLINTQGCNKYKLTNDDADDAHYISHVDGSLYVNNFEEPFSNDDYCVEFLDSGTVDVSTPINR